MINYKRIFRIFFAFIVTISYCIIRNTPLQAANYEASKIESANKFINVANIYPHEAGIYGSGIKQDVIDPWGIDECIKINLEKRVCDISSLTYNQCQQEVKSCKKIKNLANEKNVLDKLTPQEKENSNLYGKDVDNAVYLPLYLPLDLYNCKKDNEAKYGKYEAAKYGKYEAPKYDKCFEKVVDEFNNYVKGTDFFKSCSESCDGVANMALLFSTLPLMLPAIVTALDYIRDGGHTNQTSIISRTILSLGAAFVLNALMPSINFINEDNDPDIKEFPVLQVIGNSYDKIVDESKEKADLFYRLGVIFSITTLFFHASNIFAHPNVLPSLELIFRRVDNNQNVQGNTNNLGNNGESNSDITIIAPSDPVNLSILAANSSQSSSLVAPVNATQFSSRRVSDAGVSV